MNNIGDPGNWSHYLNRPDNKKLSLNEVKRNFLLEQIDFQQWMMISGRSASRHSYPTQLLYYLALQGESPDPYYGHVVTLNKQSYTFNGLPVWSADYQYDDGGSPLDAQEVLFYDTTTFTGAWNTAFIEDGMTDYGGYPITSPSQIQLVLDDEGTNYLSGDTTPTNKLSPLGLYNSGGDISAVTSLGVSRAASGATD